MHTHLANKEVFLMSSAAGKSIGNSPASFLFYIEFSLGHYVDQWRNQVRLDHGSNLSFKFKLPTDIRVERANLFSIAGSDVRHCPACFLTNGFFLVRQQSFQSGQCTAVNHTLRLKIISGNNVANGTQSRSLHAGIHVMLQKVYKLRDSCTIRRFSYTIMRICYRRDYANLHHGLHTASKQEVNIET